MDWEITAIYNFLYLLCHLEKHIIKSEIKLFHCILDQFDKFHASEHKICAQNIFVIIVQI